MKRSASFAAPDMTDWGRAAVRVDQAHEALGHRAFEAEGAVFIRNPALPDIHVANYVRSVTAGTSSAIDRLLERAERELAGCPHRCFEVDVDTPPVFEARLIRGGYEPRAFVLMVLAGDLQGRAKAVDPVLAADERSWAEADRLKRLDWAEARAKIGLAPLPGWETVLLSWRDSRRLPTASGSPTSTERRAAWRRRGRWTAWARWRTSSWSPGFATGESPRH